MINYNFLFQFFNYLKENHISIGLDTSRKKCSFIYYFDNQQSSNNFKLIEDYESYHKLFLSVVPYQCFNKSSNNFNKFLEFFLINEKINFQDQNLLNNYFQKKETKPFLKILNLSLIDFISFSNPDNSKFLNKILNLYINALSTDTISKLHILFNERHINNEEQINFFCKISQNKKLSNYCQTQIILKKFLNSNFTHEDLVKHSTIDYLIHRENIDLSKIDQFSSFNYFFSVSIEVSKLHIFYNQQNQQIISNLRSCLNKLKKFRQFEYSLTNNDNLQIFISTNNQNYQKNNFYSDLTKIFDFLYSNINRYATLEEKIIDSFIEKLVITETISHLTDKKTKTNKL